LEKLNKEAWKFRHVITEKLISLQHRVEHQKPHVDDAQPLHFAALPFVAGQSLVAELRAKDFEQQSAELRMPHFDDAQPLKPAALPFFAVPQLFVDLTFRLKWKSLKFSNLKK
jgi:hypothetical protein